MSGRRQRSSCTFFTLPRTVEAQKVGEPMGQPSRTKPSLVTGMSDGRGLRPKSSSLGMKSRDFALFRFSPLVGLSSSMMLIAFIKSSGDPQRVPSSRYHTLIRRLGTSRLIRSTIGWRAKAKPRGPKGSPCWTPQQLRIVWSPRCSIGNEYRNSTPSKQPLMESEPSLP